MIPSVVSKKDERSYDVFSRLLAERIIFITGQIDDQVADSVVAQLLLLNADDRTKEVCVYVTTLPPKGRELLGSYSQELFLLLRRWAS